MPIIPNLADVSFHEATLVGISPQGKDIKLTLDDVLISGMRQPAIVTIAGVRGILRNGSTTGKLRMEERDGEILTLRAENGKVLLVIEWNNFASRQQHTAAYDLLGGTIALHAVPSKVG
jgi:hypothetical protein